MGTWIDDTLYVGNCFPSYKSASSSSKSKGKKTVIGKATEYFTSINYDNILCGIYINVPEGKLFSSSFMHDLFNTSNTDFLDQVKIWITYERSLADLGLNPFKALRLSPKFIQSIKGKKVKEIIKHQEIFEELPMRLFRSSPDQAFLAEYVCPELSDYSGIADDEISIASLCTSFMKTLDTHLENYAEKSKSHEYSLRKIYKTSKNSKKKDVPDIDKLKFIKSVDDLTSKINDVIGINMDMLGDQ